MKLLTLIISARAYGVETLLQLAILDRLSRPTCRDLYTGRHSMTLLDVQNALGDDLSTVAQGAAGLEILGMIQCRKLFGGTGLRSILLELTPKGEKLMFGKKQTLAPA